MDVLAPRQLNFNECVGFSDMRQFSKSSCQSSGKTSTSSFNRSQQETLEAIRTLSASGSVGSKETLENIRAFLSSPEAVCGLGVENQLVLRRKLAEAEVHQEQQGVNTLPRSRVVYRDTVVPLVPVGPQRAFSCM